MRLGLKSIYGNFEEDFIKIEGEEKNRVFLKLKMAENLNNRIQGIQWYLIFENQTYGSKVACGNRSPTLTHWWR